MYNNRSLGREEDGPSQRWSSRTGTGAGAQEISHLAFLDFFVNGLTIIRKKMCISAWGSYPKRRFSSLDPSHCSVFPLFLLSPCKPPPPVAAQPLPPSPRYRCISLSHSSALARSHPGVQ
jgi:hypothetical protein